MSIFDFFKFGKRKPADPPTATSKDALKKPSAKHANLAGQTAPGLRSLRDLWGIEKNSPVERFTGSVTSDIYSGTHTNGIPRRHHPVRRPRGRGDTGAH